MAGRNLAVLGIELQKDEIRVVEVRFRAGVPFVAGSGRSAVPASDAADASAIAKIIEDLLDKIGARNADHAVFGLPFERVSYRTLVIPPAPDSELPILVAGEVEHYNLLKSRGASHTYFKLSPPGAVDTGVGVFGAEEDATSFVRDIASKAGLQVEAVEPATYAMCRTACLAAKEEETVAVVMVANPGSEIALVHGAGPIAYRRLDTGSKVLIAAPDGIHLPAAGSLSTEIKRTLDYLERQYPNLNSADRLHLVVDDPALDGLGDFLQERLGIPVELVSVTVDASGVPIYTPTGTTGNFPNAAFGLALRSDHDAQNHLPALDLFEGQRSSAVQSESRRNLLGAVLVSAAAILLAIAGYRAYGIRIADLDRSTGNRAGTHERFIPGNQRDPGGSDPPGSAVPVVPPRGRSVGRNHG